MKKIGVYGKTLASAALIIQRLEAKYNSKGYATKIKKNYAGSFFIALESLATIETIEIETIEKIEKNYFDKIYTDTKIEELNRIGKEVTDIIEI